MALHNRKLSFTTPIVVGFAGILLSFMLIAIFVTLAQQKDFLEDYHDINRNFTHNLAINTRKPCCGKMILSSGAQPPSLPAMTN